MQFEVGPAGYESLSPSNRVCIQRSARHNYREFHGSYLIPHQTYSSSCSAIATTVSATVDDSEFLHIFKIMTATFGHSVAMGAQNGPAIDLCGTSVICLTRNFSVDPSQAKQCLRDLNDCDSPDSQIHQMRPKLVPSAL
jgi:hypothetical protein